MLKPLVNLPWMIIGLVVVHTVAQPEFDPDSIIRICGRIAAYRFHTQHNNNWETSPYFAGLMSLYRLTGDATYLNRVTAWADRHDWQPYNNPLSCNGDHQ